MKRFLFVLIIMSFSICFAQEEEYLVGETTEEYNNEETYNDQPVTNDDKLAENEGKEVNSAPAKKEAPKSGNKFNQFVNRAGKKSLVGVKLGPEINHWNNGTVFWGRTSNVTGGFHFDAFFEYNFIKYFGLQVELNAVGSFRSSFTVPLIAQANIPISDMFWLNAGAGFYIGGSAFWGFDAGMIIKSALEINTKVGVFVADIRYSPSLTYLGNGSFAILVGYAVPLPF